jgi:hypothetical protein
VSPLTPLILLCLVPVAAYVVARRLVPAHTWAVSGAAFGAVISPLSLGLYSLYFLASWAFIPGMLGLLLMLMHGWPGFRIATSLGLVPRAVVTGASSNIAIELINGLVWAFVYGLIGIVVDRTLRHRVSLRS